MGERNGAFTAGFERVCPPGSFVTTVSGFSGAWVNSFAHARCTDGSELAMMQIPAGCGCDNFWDSSASGYTGIGFHARELEGAGCVYNLTITRTSGDSMPLAVYPFAEARPRRASCSPGTVIVGFHGMASSTSPYGNWRLTSLGVICNTKNASVSGERVTRWLALNFRTSPLCTYPHMGVQPCACLACLRCIP